MWVRGDATEHFYLLVHTSALTPAGKVSATQNWYGTGRAKAEVVGLGDSGEQKALLLALVEVWHESGRGELVAAAQRLKPIAHMGMPRPFVAFGNEQGPTLAPLTQVRAVQAYHTPVSAHTGDGGGGGGGTVAVIAGWVGNRGGGGF